MPVVVTVLALVVAGCSSGAPEPSAQPTPTVVDGDPLALPDPAPVPTDEDTAVGPDGGTVTVGDAELAVPAGAVPDGQEFTVPGLEALAPQPGEVFGQPVGLEHDVPLAAPVTATWQLPDLSEEQLASIVLVKWDPDLGVWTPRPDVPVTVQDGRLTAQLTEFSFWDWVANIGQRIGEVVGARVGAPDCSTKPYPSWVQDVVDPDADSDAAAIRVCFEPDSRDGILTARVANNRPFTQRLEMTDGGQSWAWTYPGQETFDLKASVFYAARAVFDSPTSFLLPPTSNDEAVGIGRPAQPGPAMITAQAEVDWRTFLVDLTTFALEQSGGVGADANPSFEALAQTVLECGGEALAGRPDLTDPTEAVRTVVGVIATCAGDIRENGPRLQRFEDLSRAAIARGGLSSSLAVKANRLAYTAAGAMKVLTVAKFFFYATDQLQNAAIGDLSLSVRGLGTPQALGAWTPTCTVVDTDSDLLFRNIAFQDDFADTSREYSQFPGWAAAAQAAVAPLAGCSAVHRQRLADAVASGWGDPAAAQVVATAILSLGGGAFVVRFDGIGDLDLSLTADDLVDRGYSDVGNLYEGTEAACVSYQDESATDEPWVSVESATGRVLAIRNSAGEQARTEFGIRDGATLGDVRAAAAAAGYSVETFLDYDFGQGSNGVVVSNGSAEIGMSLDGDDDSAVVTLINGVGLPGYAPSNMETGC